MSRENVGTVRAAFKAWNVPDMNAWRELHDPNVILRNPEGWPEPGPFVGLDAVERNFEEARGLWDTDTLEPVSDFIDVADRVLVRTIWRGVRDGIDSHLEFTIVFTVRKGKIVQIEFFWDHPEALEAMGVPAQTD
jgi:ketosteroid isomerase-like protein